MAKAKASAEPKKKIELKPLNMKAKANDEVQLHLKLHPDTSLILTLLARRYGYMSQGKYLDDLMSAVFQQETGMLLPKLETKTEEDNIKK